MMKYFLVTFLWQIMITEDLCSWTVKEISKFPHSMHTTFHLQFLQGNTSETLTKFNTETMLTTIRDRNDLIMEKHIFNYGYQYSIDEELIGKFIDIPIWQRDINTTIINITILFKSESNSKFIEIFHLPANTTETRKKMFRNLKIANLIYSKKINLLIPSKLELFVKSINQSNDELLFPNEIAIAICRAYDGVPREKPIFTNHHKFNVTKSEYNIERNERKLWFNVSLINHLKNLTCDAGNVSNNITIYIFHNPTNLYIKPELNDILQTNQTIICYVIDGYPRPILQWHFIKGPRNGSKFYHINETQLFIYANAPIGSIWEFKCTLKSTAPENSIFKTISWNISREHKNFLNQTKIDNISLMEEFNEKINLLKQHFEKVIKEKSSEIENQKKLIENNKKIIEIIEKNFTNHYGEMKIQMKTNIQNIVNRYKLDKRYDNELVWNIDDIHNKFKDIKLISNTFHNIKNVQYITVSAKFFHHEIVVNFSLFIARYTVLPKDLDVSIKLVSVLNENHYVFKTNEMSITDKNFHSSNFVFPVNDLSFAGVVNTNAIIIKCYLLWI